MTPKEKAQELVDQYRLILIHSETDAGEEILCTTIAKQCALVAVNELIKGTEDAINYHRYWHNVKQEIEKL